jgi:A/G-specific adenine glycosylase
MIPMTIGMIKSSASQRKPKRRSKASSPCSRLLAWYDADRRALPWRAPPGIRPDPYAVWLSEIMLQQTTVATVKSYYIKFINRWPEVRMLADAPLDDVLAAWAGLGYYARARNLHRCAQEIHQIHNNLFPQTEHDLRLLPGVGAYTAAAIAAIAFNAPAIAVDGNVERVMTRLHAIDAPPRRVKNMIHEKALELATTTRWGDFAQALMDLGATICTPRAPRCDLCPLTADCLAGQNKTAEKFPVKEKKIDKPKRLAAIFILIRNNCVLLQKQPPLGLFGGMNTFPSSPLNQDISLDKWIDYAPVVAQWRQLQNPVKHVFTHFSLNAHIFVAKTRANVKINHNQHWMPIDQLSSAGLPRLMHKAALEIDVLEKGMNNHEPSPK